jgi:Fic family protein
MDAMPTYVWEVPGWPEFAWNSDTLLTPLGEARYRQGSFLGRMGAAGFDTRLVSELDVTTEDVIKTSAIEGEVLNPASVRSSIAKRLGIPEAGAAPADRKVDGVVDMLLDAGKNFGMPLTSDRIWGWHTALFPTGYSGTDKIDVGMWRSDAQGPMQVVSNPFALKPKVYFEAPRAVQVPAEMERFLAWFANPDRDLDPILRAGIAHLWFVTIHPLDDGNGRIARAITDLALAQAERTGQRFYSMSAAIEQDKARYYSVLEATQKGGLDVTAWLLWFVECYGRAITAAEKTTKDMLARARFWTVHAATPFNERQRKVLGKLLDRFQGAMTSGKWANICNVSTDTALRDIQGLIHLGLLTRNPGGKKSASYSFTWPPIGNDYTPAQ